MVDRRKLGIEWLRPPHDHSAVVFVHGILSSSQGAWTHANGAFWPAMLATDDEMQNVGVGVFGYRADWRSHTYSISDAADSLRELANDTDLWSMRPIIFVCHSMGGIVVRRFLIANQRELIDRNCHVGLFFIASPSVGSSDASRLLWLTRQVGNVQAQALRLAEDNTWLNDLDKDFIKLKESGRLQIFGKEIIEDEPLRPKRILGLWTQVVPSFSAARYFSDPLKIAGTDHNTVAKPESKKSEQYVVLKNFIRTASLAYPALTEAERKSESNADRTSPLAGRLLSRPAESADPPFKLVGQSNPRVSVGKLPTVNPTLIGRDKVLHDLNAAWSDSSIRLASLVAFGGVGKTALVLNWWHKSPAIRAKRILGWSFYSQGAAESSQESADVFLDFALRRWFHIIDPPRDSWDRGECLAELVRQEPTLLILDGLEPIQFPPGVQYGRFKDRGMISLLKELAAENPGLCICTSRFPLTDLSDYGDSGVLELELENLTPEAGAEYLRSLGVWGDESELRQASIDFGNHALALTLLGSLLKRHGGNVHKREIVPSLFDAKQGGHARRVMSAYAHLFDSQYELDILGILSLFDRPADPAALRILRTRSSDEWALGLENLAQARLVEYQDPNGPIDCHPLVREYFSEEFSKSNPERFRQWHSELYHFYRTIAPEQPDTLEAMTPLFYAVYHGCQGGYHPEVRRSIYRDRIVRDEEYYLTQKLGAYGTNLSLLANFFERTWTIPVSTLDDEEKPLIVSYAAFALGALGRLPEAVDAMQASADAYSAIKTWKNAAVCFGNVSDLRLTLGNISEAVSAGRRSIELVDLSDNPEWRARMRARLASALHQAGHLEEAFLLFDEAERLESKRLPEVPFLAFRAGFQYCELLLDQGRRNEVLDRISKTMAFVTRLLDVALYHLSLGRAYGFESSEAMDEIEQAVVGLRRAGQLDELPRGLLARAGICCYHGDFVQAQRDLDEVKILANRCSMQLYLADLELEQTRLFIAQGRPWDAHSHFESAKALVNDLGYHRRDSDVVQLGRALSG